MSKDEIKLKWQQAPVKTQWGDDMVVASVAIDKDHTVCLYCERDQTPKVDAMFAQRTLVGLTDEERAVIVEAHTTDDHGYDIWCDGDGVARATEAKLRSKNNA